MAKIDIINAALDKLGQNQIASLGENSVQAVRMTSSYERRRRAILRAHNWKFAASRVTSTENGNTPDHGYEYEHDVEDDFIRLIRIVGCDDQDYSLEARKILTNLEEIQYSYVRDEEDTDLFPEDFKELLAIDLAAEHAYAFTQSTTLRDSLRQEFKEYRVEARNVISQEQARTEATENVWLNSRY